MAFTRINNDPDMIQKYLHESTGQGRWQIDVPGNGLAPYYYEDPHIRLQKWGANLRTNSINIDSDLRGLSRSINRDITSKNNYVNNSVNSNENKYPTLSFATEQSRTTMPAWTARDLDQTHWNILLRNPQENTQIPFTNNLNTRIIEKDNFVAKPPCVGVTLNNPLYKPDLLKQDI